MAAIDMDALPQCLMNEAFSKSPGVPLYIPNARYDMYIRIEVFVPRGYATPGGTCTLNFDDSSAADCYHLSAPGIGANVVEGYAPFIYVGSLENNAGLASVISLEPIIEGQQFIVARSCRASPQIFTMTCVNYASSWSTLSWVCGQTAAGTIRAWQSPRPFG